VRRQDSNLNHAGQDALQPFPWKLPHSKILGLFMNNTKRIIEEGSYRPGETPADCLTRPPVGLMPKTIHDTKRALSILDAMERYATAAKPVPVEWVHELATLFPYQRS